MGERSQARRRRWLWTLGAAMVALAVVLLALDARMREAGGPGIIGFELAGSLHRAREILIEWGEAGRRAARLSLWIDYAYLLAYGAFWALAVAATRDAARERGWRRLAAPGGWLVALPLVAAGLDAVEDVGLLLALDRHGGGAAPAVAAACATGKFAALAVSILYVLAGLVARVASRPAVE